MKRISFFLAFACFFALVSGCASQQHQPMYSLSAELNKLTAAAEGYEAYMKPDPGMSAQVFLQKATEHDPSLLAPFENYTLMVLREHGHVSILVCTREGDQALLQDVGCTNKFDNHIWQIEPSCPCIQHRSVLSICSP